MRTRDRVVLALLAFLLTAGLLASACQDSSDGGADGGNSEDAPTATLSEGGAAPGVTDSEIVLGTHFPLSQHLAAAYAPIATAGMQGYFDYINAQGGIHGRQIRFIIEDDHYTPSDTSQVVRQLVEQEQIFALVGGLGTATHSAASQFLEENGVPDMFVLTGATKWTEPTVRTRFGGNPDYTTEGKILGQHIAQEYPDAKLGLILQNDDFGVDGEAGIRDGIEGSNIEVLEPQKYEATATDLTAQVQRLKNDGAEALAIYALPPQAANAVKVAREVLDWDVPIIVTGVDATDIFIDLAGAEHAEGVVSVVFARQIYETSDPGIAQHIDIVQQYGDGAEPSNLTVAGQAVAELMVKALQDAGPDLTRDSLLDAAEAMRGFQCLVCLVPVSFSETDHRPFEIEQYARVEDGRWVTFGEPVDFESTK